MIFLFHNMQAQQLTFGLYGHTLHHTQIQSHNGQYLVYDSRNDDTQIASTQTIEVLQLESLATQVIYRCNPAGVYGPGVGAATFSPQQLQTLFIHGIKNASPSNPYSMTRRTGVSIFLNNPGHPIYMDARNIYEPFTAGALRGGTHAHAWHPNGNLISFTYNDFVLEHATHRNADRDLRSVGVMFPQSVSVFKDEEGENNSGEMFAVLVSEVVNQAQPNTDEIEKAFDECWLGSLRKLAFQGHVRDAKGKLQSEIFIVDLPDNLSQAGAHPLQGTATTRCGVPLGTKQYRITHTPNGISNFRHWLRSNSSGTLVYFLMEDDLGCTQLFQVAIASQKIKQLSFHDSGIHSPFNVHVDAKNAVYLQHQSLVLLDLETGQSNVLFESTADIQLTGIPHFCNHSNTIYFNAYVKYNTASYIQIFRITY
ncbi:DUF3748 domain-containing protein [Flavobacterium agricola]|uniref:DUF3748 domain-containing protein n=1 Tax=Flavobacterium agricola TaxID=2870839 RepID=A0ABY6LZP8_9FLAO|nr:DUF3748 domain-containing protein [Flavobacterium agricola]UYW01709.1 DUF3748 domain-containing protein [Flavobacterium agricola]